MKIPLEDLFEDIVGKAQRGLRVSDQDLCRRAQLSVVELRSLKKESGDPEVIPGIANALNLDPKALAESYARSWYPSGVPETDGAKQFNSALMDMTVNAYLVWNPETKDAAIFDTGSDAKELSCASGNFASKHVSRMGILPAAPPMSCTDCEIRLQWSGTRFSRDRWVAPRMTIKRLFETISKSCCRWRATPWFVPATDH